VTVTSAGAEPRVGVAADNCAFSEDFDAFERAGTELGARRDDAELLRQIAAL